MNSRMKDGSEEWAERERESESGSEKGDIRG